MKRLGYFEAAHRVRMTPVLLKWFASYAPRGDGRKLGFDAQGTIDEAELLAFDQHLRQDWGTRVVPTGIRAELAKEALGHCALCSNSQVLEVAHIDRKGIEVPFYCQHPHNLLTMCSQCHGRYDQRDPNLSHEVVSYRKQVLQAQLLLEVDTDVRLGKEIESALSPMRALFEKTHAEFWTAPAGKETLQRLVTVSGSVGVTVPSPAPASRQALLTALSGGLQPAHPVAAAKIESLVDGLGTDAEAWEHLDEGPEAPYMCSYGDEIALVESAECSACGEQTFDFSNEVPISVDDEEGASGIT